MNMGSSGGSDGEVGEVALIADELSRAVELTLNPTVAHDARSQAYNACESFKENSPWCAQAGLLLASGGQYSAVVKHFGLQLMEHTVKYRWTQITQAEKIFIKENAMKLLYMGGWETGHLNDALARVIVEMIKREWPQQWPTLLAELSDACGRGHLQTEIVLHVFLRLVEDVATLQTLEQHQRRKDIYQALTGNMAEIFAFFMRLIELHVHQFRELTAKGDYANANSNGRVVQVVLLTLTGFVEWVSTSHVVANDGRLLQMLCILLQDDAFRLPAAECLLQVVNRKGPTKERKPLMILFSEDAISCVHRAALASIAAPGEHHYAFLKTLSQVLAGLAQQLTSMWAHATNVDSWLPVLLETMLLMTSHPSLTLAHTANTVWLTILKHEQMAKLPHVLAVVPRWLQAAAPKTLKVVYPSSRAGGAHDAVSYACMDYDSEQEFATFFLRCRTGILDSFRYCMTAAPLVTWAFAEQWTGAALDKVEAARAEPLHTRHPLYIELEALGMVVDVVVSRLLTASPRPSAAAGLALLARCANAAPPDPLALSLSLSLISALFVFLSCANSQLAGPGVCAMGAELLPRVLDAIFAALVFGDDAPAARQHRAVKNVRRHAAGLLVKLACKYPLVLLPVWERLHGLTAAALARHGLSAVESVTLQEALLLVANHFGNYERQAALVAEVLGDCSERWATLAPHVATAPGLARLIGLHLPPAGTAGSDAAAEEEAGNARRTLLHALTLLLGVVKRTQVPSDPDKASRGGFGAGVTAAGNPVWRNPCAAHALPLFPHALALCRSLHDLHAPEHAACRHAVHARCLDLPAAERRNLLGLRASDDPAASGAGAGGTPSPQDRMQNYIHTLHDNVCHLVGATAQSLGRELYGATGVARFVAGSLLAGLPRLPGQWLRRVARAALRPLLQHCPPKHYRDVALPLIEHAHTFMLHHLSARWEYITSLYEAGKLDEDGSESQEVVEDMLVRNLTREYLEVVKITLMEGSIAPEASGDGEMDDDGGSGGSGAAPSQRAPEQVSELGQLVLAHPVAGPAALHLILRALTWNDSQSSLRATAIALPALRAALAAGCVGAADAATALAATLQALRTHGQHDANQAALLALAVQTYEVVRPRFPAVAAVLRAIPGVDAADLQRLDERVHAPAAKPAKIDKAKRDLFKKITARLIGRNVGQLFKKEVYILNLPTMQTVKERPRSAVDAPEGAGLDGLFAQAPAT